MIEADVNARCLQTLSKQGIVLLQWRSQEYVTPMCGWESAHDSDITSFESKGFGDIECTDELFADMGAVSFTTCEYPSY
jgi:hypothetical protein